MQLPPAPHALFTTTATHLRGSARRLFMARTVPPRGRGGAATVERALGWNRATGRQGPHELRCGRTGAAAFGARGCQPAEVYWPHLLPAIVALVTSQSQTDPQCKAPRLYTRLTVAEVRRPLITQRGYWNPDLPSARTIRRKLPALG
ncbi:MAG: hypothetical protein M3Z04_05315 [Chloroflexota bacterium]|nr:hypothetical protein [Chloroflexota bacterium]